MVCCFAKNSPEIAAIARTEQILTMNKCFVLNAVLYPAKNLAESLPMILENGYLQNRRRCRWISMIKLIFLYNYFVFIEYIKSPYLVSNKTGGLLL